MPEPGISTQPLRTVLDDLAGVVFRLSAEEYAARPVGGFPSGIGGQARHCLDLVRAWLDARPYGQIDYEDRRRGDPIESNRNAALAEIRSLEERLRILPDRILECPVWVVERPSADRPPVEVASTFARELLFLVSHTIHHNAIIGAMVRALAKEVPERFGYAPSTLVFLEQAACAR